ncbi:MAG TPA: ectonucleotide pyrophosphatase/phosphodiesterase [Longimicrobiales bacterium]|nr:ectonucleotide pyrophosphatase/phosphodiesterase [Longimicrobiales bacterium]
MNPLRLGLTLLGLVGAIACGNPPAVDHGRTNAPARQNAPYVVLLSMDGFRYDYLDRYPTPALMRLAAEGVRADRMIPVFPSKTFPTHYTVATGMYAEHHGLVGNRYWAPDKGALYDMGDRGKVEDGSWYRGEPIWVTAERQGMLSASYFFVGSEADVGGMRPTYWHRYDGRVSNADRVDGVLAWLALPAEERPHMITMYFSDLDNAGHEFGPDSPQVEEAVSTVDRHIGRLLDGIAALPHGDQVYVVLVSDHGMLKAEGARAQRVDMDLFPGVRLVEGGPYASLVVDEGGASRAAAVRDSLRAMLPEAQVWLREEVPQRLHYSADARIGDIVILADPGATVGPRGLLPTRDSFTHGWDNAIPEMGAIFLARGPGIEPGQRIEAFESVHVYPFLAHLLGLVPNPGIDGRLEILAPVLGGR